MNWDELRPYTGIDIRDFVVTGRANKAFALTGDELYKQIYRTTNRFDPNNVELCISQIGGVRKDGLFTRTKRDMEVISILHQGDTGTYNPQIVHLHLEHYKEIWHIIQRTRELIEGRYVFGEEGEGMLEPTYAQMTEGANILKPVYEKYQEFEFDARLYRECYRMPSLVWEFFNLCETAKIFWEKREEPKQTASKPQQVPTYTEDLIKLFNGNTHLIDELIGKSDNDIAICILSWATEKDKFGKPLIVNPANRLKQAFAKALKENGIIRESESNFRKRL